MRCKTFYMPPGYRIELVASEPLVQDPTVIDWDLEGRLWVVEMTGFVRGMDAPEPNHDRIGRVVVLEDTNGDGRMDRRTVFADGLILPRALKVLDRGVLVGEPGSLWFMRDTNRRPEGRHQGARHQPVRPAPRQRRRQREQPAVGDGQLDSHGGRRRVPALEGRTVRSAPHAAPRRVGRDAGRRRSHLPEHERVRASRRLRPDAVLRAQSQSAPHPRQL